MRSSTTWWRPVRTHQIQTNGIAEPSYLVGHDSEGFAAVFDPRPDVDCYLQLAREKQVSITHIFETHIHAGLVSARELGARVETAKIFVSHEGGARYGFDHGTIKAGDTFKLGSVLITVRHTPGHTPEHVAAGLNIMPAKPKPKPQRPKAPRRRPGPPNPSPGPYNPQPPKRPGRARK